jgi:LysM repeat protein
MECYACSNEATRQCRRCARVFCELHGGELCAECLSPGSSLPSFNVYRGSLLALLIGSAIALWLVVRPPGSSDGQEVIIANVSPSPVLTSVARTATPPRTSTPRATEPSSTESPATETPAPRTYTVQDGDTLLGIAERLAPEGVSATDYANQIAAASGLASLEEDIRPGQVLTLPP